VKHGIPGGLLLLGAMGAVFRPGPLLAADSVQLTYTAPDGCPSEANFRVAVTERGGQFDRGSSPSSVRELQVSVAQDERGFRGSLQSSSADSASAVRTVHGSSCQEVVDALAVVSALALRGEEPPPPAVAAEPPPEPPPAAAPVPPAPPLPPEHRLRANETIGNRRMRVSAGTLSFDKARALSVLAGGELGLLPRKIVPRLDLSFDVASLLTTPSGKSYLDGIVPRVRLSYFGKASQSFHGTDSSGALNTVGGTGSLPFDASSTLQGVSFGMGLCWSPFYDTRGFVVLFCFEYGAGVLKIRATDTSVVQPNLIAPGTYASTLSKTTGFSTAGVGFEGRYNLGSLFHVALKLGADALVNAVTAERTDGAQIFHSSSILGYGMLGLGLHF
jgi:hypothetical protein